MFKVTSRYLYVIGGLLLITFLCLLTTVYLNIRNANLTVYSKQPPPPKVQPKPLVVTINYDKFGFDPNIVKVPVGTIVTVKNITNQNLLFQPLYGQPNQNNSLNLGNITPRQSKSFTITKTGVWQYEGQNNPEIRGLISTGKLTPNIAALSINAPIKNNILLIKYDDYGFMPNEITVPYGTSVTIENISDNTQPGPMLILEKPGQLSDPQLNFGVIAKQQSKISVLTIKGTWIYEDVYQPKPKSLGQITVN